VFTPVKGFSGTATPIRYQVTDSVGQTANATYTPTITPAGVSAAASTLPDTGAQGIGVLTMFAIVISVIGCCAIVASTIWRRKTQLR
jgi:hypothetical protein